MPIRSSVIKVLGMLVASVTLMISSSHGQGTPAPRVNPSPDAVHAAQRPSDIPLARPAQQKSSHDRSSRVSPGDFSPKPT